MEENIIEHSNGTAIFNGGNPLDDCPKDWDEAKAVIEKLNENHCDDYGYPKWSFDCGFKLDYDGDIIRINSRFYPPKTHYGKGWDGFVSVYILDEKISDKKFDCPTLDELRIQVESFVRKYVDAVKCNKDFFIKLFNEQ